MYVDLIGHRRIESIEQDYVHRIGGLDQRKIRINVGRHRRQLDLHRWRAFVLFEVRNGLWLAIFENFEVFLLESCDWLALIVGHYSIDENQTGFGFEGGDGLHIRSCSLVLGRNGNRCPKHEWKEAKTWKHSIPLLCGNVNTRKLSELPGSITKMPRYQLSYVLSRRSSTSIPNGTRCLPIAKQYVLGVGSYWFQIGEGDGRNRRMAGHPGVNDSKDAAIDGSSSRVWHSASDRTNQPRPAHYSIRHNLSRPAQTGTGRIYLLRLGGIRKQASSPVL